MNHQAQLDALRLEAQDARRSAETAWATANAVEAKAAPLQADIVDMGKRLAIAQTQLSDALVDNKNLRSQIQALATRINYLTDGSGQEHSPAQLYEIIKDNGRWLDHANYLIGQVKLACQEEYQMYRTEFPKKILELLER